MNLTTDEDGLFTVAEETACLVPDTFEAIDRLDEIEALMVKHLAEFGTAIGAAKTAMMSLHADVQLLRSELRDDRAEVERRLLAIQQGAEKLGYPFLALPKLRVMAEFPGGEAR